MSGERTEPLGRLLDDPDLAGELRADLLAAKSFQVPFDASAGLARFQAHLASLDRAAPDATEGPSAEASGTAHGPVASAAAPALQLTGGKVLAALALAAGLGWGALELAGGGERGTPARSAADAATPKAPAPRSTNASPRSTTPAPMPAAEAPVAEDRAKAALAPKLAAPARQGANTPRALLVPALPAPAPEPVPDPASASSASTAPTAADLLAQEVAHLGEVRRALAVDPARALTLADQGHARFADGALRQERESLALSALDKLGRRDALSQRGARFLERYPTSSFAPQVKRMLSQ